MSHKSFALAREWVIGIVLAFIIPMLTFYGVEVFNTYVRGMQEIVVTPDMPTAEFNEAIELRNAQNELKNRTLFYTALIVGLAAIIAGNFIFHGYLALTIGLTLGGLFTLVMGYFWYWHKFGLLIKFGSLIGALVLLLFIAFSRLRK